jgi:hypothetical protein
MPSDAPIAPLNAPTENARDFALWRKILRRVGGAAGVQVVTVPNGATAVAVTFPRRESDAAYGWLVSPSWDTTAWVTTRTETGCTLHVAAGPVGAQPCTLMIVREG